jgi:hypothetical protein
MLSFNKKNCVCNQAYFNPKILTVTNQVFIYYLRGALFLSRNIKVK